MVKLVQGYPGSSLKDALRDTDGFPRFWTPQTPTEASRSGPTSLVGVCLRGLATRQRSARLGGVRSLKPRRSWHGFGRSDLASDPWHGFGRSPVVRVDHGRSQRGPRRGFGDPFVWAAVVGLTAVGPFLFTTECRRVQEFGWECVSRPGGPWWFSWCFLFVFWVPGVFQLQAKAAVAGSGCLRIQHWCTSITG